MSSKFGIFRKNRQSTSVVAPPSPKQVQRKSYHLVPSQFSSKEHLLCCSVKKEDDEVHSSKNVKQGTAMMRKLDSVVGEEDNNKVEMDASVKPKLTRKKLSRMQAEVQELVSVARWKDHQKTEELEKEMKQLRMEYTCVIELLIEERKRVKALEADILYLMEERDKISQSSQSVSYSNEILYHKFHHHD